ARVGREPAEHLLYFVRVALIPLSPELAERNVPEGHSATNDLVTQPRETWEALADVRFRAASPRRAKERDQEDESHENRPKAAGPRRRVRHAKVLRRARLRVKPASGRGPGLARSRVDAGEPNLVYQRGG